MHRRFVELGVPLGVGLWIVLGALAAQALPAAGQPGVSVREMIAENERLTAELRDAEATIDRLEAELAGLRNDRRGLEARIRDAEQVLTSLRREMTADRQPPASGAPRAPLPADPLASPATLLRELRSRYFNALRDVPDTTATERVRYKEQVALWCRLTQRELRGKRTWLVRFDELVPLRGDRAVARMTVLDEASGLPIGDPVDVAVPPRFAERIRVDARFDRWQLTSVVIAKPRYNEDRQTRGVFEFPPFVGPHVDFDFELDWVALSGWRPDGAADADETPSDEGPSDENPDANADR
ncbi:MAG: hypothetical protein AAGF47_05520 [Planctomycetota bacterium]